MFVQASVIAIRAGLMLLAAGLVACGSFAPKSGDSRPAEPASAAEKHWQRVFAGESKVGFVEHSRRQQGASVINSEMLTIELATALTRQTYTSRLDVETTADGALLRVVRESRTPEGHTLIDARRVGDDLVVDIGAGNARSTRKLEAVGALQGDEFARAWLAAVGSGQAQPPLVYRGFDPNRLAIVDVTLTHVEKDAPPFQAKRTTRLGNAQSEQLLTLDAAGQVIDESMRLGGTTLRLVASTEAEARARGERLNHVVAQMQKAPYRIPERDMHAKIRYGFAHGGRAPVLPVGAGQRSWSDDQTTWIQVCASCALDAAALSDEERARALAATPWLNFEDAAFSRRARREAGGATSPARKMARLTSFVRGHMAATTQIDMLGYGSAFEAWKSRRGDCTEYAVLLAAMGRAAGVPTRVVSGLVYARRFEGQRHVFVPHAWVHAWTGNGWESFDAGIGSFDSTHLAFAVSYDGNPAQLFSGIHLAHELKLRSAARVVPAPVK
jgi:hypothetical protein